MQRESSVPQILLPEHIGSRVIVRLPGSAGPSEGIVEEISPENAFVRIGKRWIMADGDNVLAILSGPRKRRETKL